MKKILQYLFGFLFILTVALLTAYAIDRQNRSKVTFLPASSVLVARPTPFATEIFPSLDLVKTVDLGWHPPMLSPYGHIALPSPATKWHPPLLYPDQGLIVDTYRGTK